MIKIIDYPTQKAMNKGVKKMKRKGWRKTDVRPEKQPVGCALFTFMLPKKTFYYVTFEK